MKRFLPRVALFVALQLAVAAVFAAAWRPNPQHFLAGTIDKHRLLAETPSPRLLLVGGSNVPFSINCDSLAARLEQHPVDMGLHAGLGAGFVLGEVRGELRPGDVVVLSIEYEQFGIIGQPEIVLRLLNARPRSVEFLPLDYWPGILDYGLSYAGIVVRGGVERMRGRVEPLQAPYVRTGFNAFGDDTLRPPTTKLPPVELPLFGDGRLPRRFDATLAKINRFRDECDRRGVKVFFTHAVVPETRWRLHGATFRKVEARLGRDMRVPFLEAPEEVVYADSLFYDTEYHLKTEGVAQRSQKLARALERALTSTSTPR